MTSPDMIWYECSECDREFTLADVPERAGCPHCGSRSFSRTGGASA